MLAGVIGVFAGVLVGLRRGLVMVRVSLISRMHVVAVRVIFMRMGFSHRRFRRCLGERRRGFVPDGRRYVRVMVANALRLMSMIVVAIMMVRVFVAVVLAVVMVITGFVVVRTVVVAMIVAVIAAIGMVMDVMLVRLIGLRRVLTSALDDGALDALAVTAAA
jgi:hypothetical protein